MAQIAQLSTGRADRVAMFVLLLAVVPAGAASGSEPPPRITATPLPKVEHQTVGTGPRFLTPSEERKQVAPPRAQSSQTRPARLPEGAAPALPASAQVAVAKAPALTTFVPVPGFAERSLLAKPIVESPGTRVGSKAGPAR